MTGMRTAISTAATAGILAAGGLLAGFTGAAPAGAATVACKTTHTYTHSSSPTGAESQTWTTKHTCGKDYTKQETRDARTAKGATSVETLVKIETYPHYVQTEHLRSVSAKGVVSYKVEVTRG
jgi:hypothetical protein